LQQPGVEDQTIATYDRIAAAWADAHWEQARDAPRQAFAQAIAGTAPPERFRILDAGCGPGCDAHWFHQRGFQVVGVDASTGMLAEARRRAPGVELHQADLRRLDFPLASFDGVWCAAALLHLPRADVPAVLARFNQLLGHGYLWVSVKAGAGEAVDEHTWGRGNPRRYTYFSRPELELMLERAGFDVHAVNETPAADQRPHPWLSVLSQTKLHMPAMGAAAVIFDADGRVLLSERTDGRGWNLPAGFVDADESPQAAAVRETREETGLAVEVDALVGLYTTRRRYRGFGPPVSGTLVSHAFLARPVGGTLAPTNEALQHGWFSPDALPTPMSSQRHVEMIRDALALRAGRLTHAVLREYC
jgi:ADP-ribose pyrophosphatase YjhB (NUDIX family)